MSSGTEASRVVPLTCHGHSRPITHLSFSSLSASSPQSQTAGPQPTPAAYYLISACKDNNPMLRDGTTGDWIGTFIGHKGAVWSSRLSTDAALAITGSADFTARIWDTFTGQCRAVLPHEHIVRAVAFEPCRPLAEGQGIARPMRAATGGLEKKLRVWDLDALSIGQNAASVPDQGSGPGGEKCADADPKPLHLDPGTHAMELAPGEHAGTIKSIIWTPDPNILITAADDGKIRWFDLRSPGAPVATHVVRGAIGSCELGDGLVPASAPTAASTDSSTAESGTTRQETEPLLSVAAGTRVYIFNALKHELVKEVELGQEASSVALSGRLRRFITGAAGDTWVRVWDYDSGEILETIKGHHGPVWSASFSPDGAKIAATGSEDGTVKLHKFCKEPYGLWR